jgi:hypothetical protein
MVLAELWIVRQWLFIFQQRTIGKILVLQMKNAPE